MFGSTILTKKCLSVKELVQKVRYSLGETKKVKLISVKKPNGEILELKTKVKTEVRMCVGVAKIEKENGEVEGVKTDLLDYSNRTIKSIKVYQDLFKQRIRELKQKYEDMDDHDWIQHLNKEKISRSDLLVKRKFVGEKKSKCLNEIGMYTYGNLHDYQEKKNTNMVENYLQSNKTHRGLTNKACVG